MIRTKDNTLRLPKVSEKEIIMGFDAGYVSQSFSDKLSEAEVELIGGQMLGNTFNVHATTMLLHECLRHYGGEQVRDARQLIGIKGISPKSWTKYPRFVTSTKETPEVSRLVAHVLRHGERGGTDVRLDLNIPFRMKAWPRSGIRSSLFNWAIIHGYTWKHTAHI